jgi:hypothetical protein
MGRACSTNGAKRNTYRISTEKPEGKKSIRRPRLRWEVNIKVDLRETECGGIYWIELTQDRDQ